MSEPELKNGYFVENGRVFKFIIQNGVRYVHSIGDKNERSRSINVMQKVRDFVGKHKS